MIQVKTWWWCDVIPQNTSADRTCVHIILSTEVRGIYFAEPDTIRVFTIFSGLFKGGTRLAMPNIMRAGLIIIEARFRGYLLGNVVISKNFLRTRKIMVMI